MSAELAWRPLTSSDLPLLAEWLQEPQVARWWNHESSAEAVERDFGPSVRGEEAGEDLVVSIGGRPIGLVQRSFIADYPSDLAEFSALVDVPDGAVELDYLIADRTLRGRGLGSRMIAAAIEKPGPTIRAFPWCWSLSLPQTPHRNARWRRRACSGSRKARRSPTTRSTTLCTSSTGSTGPENTRPSAVPARARARTEGRDAHPRPTLAPCPLHSSSRHADTNSAPRPRWSSSRACW
ncbi:GNAT family N-acetyltransferase [Pengzhenrongella phosphoraccumulans]|uniref:GNAT family N-acetyltransferase n=1 Tax=Pengzhenrongella phosphoraccumulans TaxID=3114394 RepID=UPI00388E542D